MTERDFYYWLQGFFEISESNKLTEKQIQVIRDHLNLVEKTNATTMPLEKYVDNYPSNNNLPQKDLLLDSNTKIC